MSRIFLLLFFLIFLSLNLLTKGQDDTQKEDLLLIVGQVTTSNVRILYEYTPSYHRENIKDKKDLELYDSTIEKINELFTKHKNINFYKNSKTDFEFIYLMMNDTERKYWTNSHTQNFTISLQKMNENEILQELLLEMKDREGPKSISFDNLLSDTCYSISFKKDKFNSNLNKKIDTVNFCTFQNPKITIKQSNNQNQTINNYQANNNLKIISISCSRIFEDQDCFTWNELYENEFQPKLEGKKPTLLMAHLGDQVYADFVYREYIKKIVNQFLKKREELGTSNLLLLKEIIEAFRYIYRTSWRYSCVQR